MGNATAAQLANQTAETIVANDALTQLFMKNQEATKSKYGEAATLSREVGAAEGTAIQETGKEKMKAEDAVQLAATTFQADLTQPENRIAGLAAQGKDFYERANAALDEIHQKRSVGFLDSPLEYIGNQLTLPDDYAEYNYAAKKHNLAMSEIESLNAATQTQQQTQRNLTRTVTESSIAAAVKKAAVGAEIEATKLEVAGWAANAQALEWQRAANTQQLNMQFNVFQARNSEAQLQLAREAAAERKREFDERMALKTVGDEDAAAMATAITMGYAKQHGGDVNSPTVVFTPQMLRREKDFMTNERKAELQRLYAIGMQVMGTKSPDGKYIGTYVAASSPGDAALPIIHHNAKGAIGQETLYTVLKEATQQAEQVAAGPGGVPVKLNPQQLVTMTDKVFGTVSAEMAKNVEKVPSGYSANIYGAPTHEALVTAMPALKATKFYGEVISPLRTALKDEPVGAKQVMASTLEAVKTGKLSLNEAATEVQGYYNSIVQFNNAQANYTSIGMKPQKEYNVKVGFLGDTAAILNRPYSPAVIKNVDLADISSVRAYLIQNIAGGSKKGTQ